MDRLLRWRRARKHRGVSAIARAKTPSRARPAIVTSHRRRALRPSCAAAYRAALSDDQSTHVQTRLVREQQRGRRPGPRPIKITTRSRVTAYVRRWARRSARSHVLGGGHSSLVASVRRRSAGRAIEGRRRALEAIITNRAVLSSTRRKWCLPGLASASPQPVTSRSVSSDAFEADGSNVHASPLDWGGLRQSARSPSWGVAWSKRKLGGWVP
jgi:hypothetical protein